MKSHLLLTTIAAVVLVGCGASMDIHEAAEAGNITVVKYHLDAGVNVNVEDERGKTPLDLAISRKHPETSDLIRKNGGKTRKELKAEGN